MRILLVDDDPSIRELLVEVLGMKGHAVVEAETWLDAVALLDSQAIELAIVDGQFPKDPIARAIGPYGPVLCQQARGLGARTILLSASEELVEDEQRRGYAALLKPFGLRALLAAVAPPAGGGPAAPCLLARARAA